MVSHKCKSGRFISKKRAHHLRRLSSLTEQVFGNESAQDHLYCTPANPHRSASSEVPSVGEEIEVLSQNEKCDTWSEGRRVVELGVLAEALKHCSGCHMPLQLADCCGESTYGLGSVLHINCTNPSCGVVNKIPTGKRHRCGKRGPPTNDVNTKLATGMLHTGIGERQVNMLLTTMNIKHIHHSSLKHLEREAGKFVEEVATQSVESALQCEGQLTVASTQETQGCQTDNPELTVSVDGGWQKRGSGRAYNSLSGHCTMVGKNSGKCIAYGIRSKGCRVCTSSKRKGRVEKPHDCRQNWVGSAKAMEADIVVDMVKQINSKDCTVKTLVGDEDATTIAHVRSEVDEKIEKRTDKNHLRKSLGNELYTLQKKHKGALSSRTIQYLQKCFNYMCSQNQGNPEGIENGLSCIVAHAFGDHQKCQESWCGYLKDPVHYRHKTLPHGRNLSGNELRNDLSKVFDKYIPMALKLSDLQSTQNNESINQMIARKAPKSQHYSGSESLNFRVSAAIAQKNEGFAYVSKVHDAAGLSPGRFCHVYNEKLDSSVKRMAKHKRSKSFKRRCLELKRLRSGTTEAAEVREGPTYKTSIGLSATSPNVEAIPPPQCPPTVQPLPSDEYTFITFDLETTDRARTANIVQLSAVCGQEEFDTYILPRKPISKEASAVTNLHFENGQLSYRGEIVSTLSIETGLKNFLEFLQKFNKPVLMAHNGHNFDAPILVNELSQVNLLEPFKKCVYGIVDTLKLFRESHPDLTSHRQESLAFAILEEQYNAHNSLDDVKILQRIVQTSNPSLDSKLSHSISLNYITDCLTHSQIKEAALETLEPLVKSKLVTKHMAVKMAKTGLSMSHLQLAFSRDGHNGVEALLKEPLDGKPRVTSHKNLIVKILSYF